eukprot:145397-Chlamydomonas_euryale.AAC.1
MRGFECACPRILDWDVECARSCALKGVGGLECVRSRALDRRVECARPRASDGGWELSALSCLEWGVGVGVR